MEGQLGYAPFLQALVPTSINLLQCAPEDESITLANERNCRQSEGICELFGWEQGGEDFLYTKNMPLIPTPVTAFLMFTKLGSKYPPAENVNFVFSQKLLGKDKIG